jgi:hypothetical protein
MGLNTEMKKLSIRNRPSQKMPSKEIPRGKMHVIKRSKSQVHHDEHSIADATIYVSANNVDPCRDE